MNDSKKNTPRAIPKLPRGFIDYGPADIAATERMLAAIKESYALYGFEPVETPFIEYTEALGKFLPDQDRPNEGVFSFQDDDEQWLSLRYDLTAPLARYVAENYDRLPKPYRSYRAGPVFRNEKPGPGRYRQFMQFDADTVGSSSVAADAELCMMAADTLERLGIKRGDYVIKVNNRKMMDGWMESIGVTDPAQKLKMLRAIDTFDRLGIEGVNARLGKGRKDSSGDTTEGAGLNEDQITANAAFLTVTSTPPGTTPPLFSSDTATATSPKKPPASPQKPAAKKGKVASDKEALDSARKNVLFLQGESEIDQIREVVRSAGYGEDRIRFDRTVVRGLEYYTGPVFEAELTFEIAEEDGRPVRFGSVGGGGRYDGLVGRFRAEDVPATGFSIGVSRLYAALQKYAESQKANVPIISGAQQRGPVVVLVLDQSEIGRYQQFVSALRNEGIPAELYLGSSGMNAQLKYADKRGSICAVIQGSNEREKGEVGIRDLIFGAELAASSKDRADYLELRSKAQFSVPEGDVVKAVKEVLARHT